MSDLPNPTNELRRSFAKLDFSGISRERSFVRPQHQHHPQLRDGRLRRGGGQAAVRGKPSLELYRPPNTRSEVDQANGLSLNVHAKEFVTMKQGMVQNSRSSVNLTGAAAMNHVAHHRSSMVQQQQLQQSKSSGNILNHNSLNHSRSSHQALVPVQQSASSVNILQGPRVHFSDMPSERVAPSSVTRSPLKSASVVSFPHPASPGGVCVGGVGSGVDKVRPLSVAPHILHLAPGLKRSKSLGAADVAMGVVKEAPDLGSFPVDVQTNIRKALEDPNQLSSRILMELVRHIMERAVSSVLYALPAAKLCIAIIEKEKKETFLESLLNSCQQWYQERDKVLRGTGQTPRYSSFMQFLNEMYCELKRRQLQLKMQQQGSSPGLVILTLLCKCCQDCLKAPQTQGKTDSLFFVLTSVGRDLEQELPSKLNHLVSSVRDTFLNAPAVPQIKKTLLQLIELHAAHWQLTASAVMYYTTQQ